MRIPAAVAVAVLLLFAASSLAEEPATITTTTTAAVLAKPAAFLAVAEALSPGASAAAVESLAKQHELGGPRLTFRWCNAAGCVERHDLEVGSTWMTVSWMNDDALLTVVLCRDILKPRETWRVAVVRLAEKSTRGAFGTRVEGRVLHEKRDHEAMRPCMTGR